MGLSKGEVCVIVNPAASRGRGQARLHQIESLLAGYAEFHLSRGGRHTEELAALAAERGFPTVVAAGGDGTVHQVANGLMQVRPLETALGVIPLGSGNDYARSLQLPRSMTRLCRRLVNGTVSPVDVGWVEDDRGRRRFFVNTLGIGLSGAVVWEAGHIRRLSGLPLYATAALRSIWRHYTAPVTRLRIDDVPLETPTLYLAVALGQHEGGGFRVAPDAQLDDGWFDYLHGGRLSRLDALFYLPRLALGWIPKDHDEIRFGRCRHLTVEADEPILAHVDGEVFGSPQTEIQRIETGILPRSLLIRGRHAASNGPLPR